MRTLPPEYESTPNPSARRRTPSGRRQRLRRRLCRHGIVMGVCVAVLAAGGFYTAGEQAAPTAASGQTDDPVTVSSPRAADAGAAAGPVPLRMIGSVPASGRTGVDGTAALTITTDQPVDPRGPMPSIDPAVAGTWTAHGQQLAFTPTGAFPPGRAIRVSVPAGLRSTHGAVLGRERVFAFRTSDGSVLALQEDLAALDYLPLRFVPSAPPDRSPAGREKAVYHPEPGQFEWTWPSVPAALSAVWSPGQETVIVRGAVMAFEADHGLTVDGLAGERVWKALLDGPGANQHGYTYALASKDRPETLTVWHDGRVLSTSRANTGIALAPTPDGTFPVYERLAKQVMRGTNPDGTHYADPVTWVAYFNGGDAIHYMSRATYGSPQSLGCVEIPYAVGETIWPHLTIGTLVTVAG